MTGVNCCELVVSGRLAWHSGLTDLVKLDPLSACIKAAPPEFVQIAVLKTVDCN